jgi:IS30 family transposase
MGTVYPQLSVEERRRIERRRHARIPVREMARVFQRLVPALDLALGLRVVWGTAA